MEWGERLIAATAEKKRANGGGTVEAPVAVMRKEERYVALFYFVFFMRSSVCGPGAGCGPVLQVQLARPTQDGPCSIII